MKDKTITLYHGTSASYLDSILERGLLPRNKTGNSNYDGNVVSKAGFVYLTTCYPVYFALNTKEDLDDIAVIEVEVPVNRLYPDEDFIARCLHHHNAEYKDMPLDEVNTHVNLSEWKHIATACLEHNGVVAVRQVTPAQIKRSVVLSVKKDIRAIMSIGGDSMPIPMSYKFLGPIYTEAIQTLFDKGPEEASKVFQKRFMPSDK